ncbi:ComEA family DNA-binding protein [Leifsonia sp. TF02-11]|uniref:ComEA family DNA-binding protein n=1 Tax=Leifsonia sp. TF02-11 TaxID=2815212 RepID=UPI001AA0CAC1|nr:ComEA family DNA-binding protein [Leifsonia sp. TF02-11]MBO1738318.1 helix-hairpin-helix domain-containing protein [Leifsonia sp. TF02-11]
MRHRAGETERAPSRRLRVGVGAATVLLIAAFVIAALVSGMSGGQSVPLPSVAASAPATPSGTPQAAEGDELYVHVSGAVARPGLIRVASGSRVVDAVDAAGGFAETADPAGVNLARFVRDGEQLRVPALGEVAAVVDGATGEAGAGGAVGGLVDLNRATTTQLETLPRIGPALAQRIIEWREAHGGFSAVTDLRSVSGVGEKLFDALKDRVTV